MLFRSFQPSEKPFASQSKSTSPSFHPKETFLSMPMKATPEKLPEEFQCSVASYFKDVQDVLLQLTDFANYICVYRRPLIAQGKADQHTESPAKLYTETWAKVDKSKQQRTKSGQGPEARPKLVADSLLENAHGPQ